MDLSNAKHDAARLEATRTIIVMGVSGCGKSTIGRLLAKKMAASFLEGDDFHPQTNLAKMASAVPLSDEDRWPWLDVFGDALRTEMLADHAIVGTCSALKRAYRDRLRNASGQPLFFVCLDLDAKNLACRLLERQGHFMPVSLLRSQLETLELPQADEAAILVSSMRKPDEVVQIILDHLGTGDKI